MNKIILGSVLSVFMTLSNAMATKSFDDIPQEVLNKTVTLPDRDTIKKVMSEFSWEYFDEKTAFSANLENKKKVGRGILMQLEIANYDFQSFIKDMPAMQMIWPMIFEDNKFKVFNRLMELSK